MTSSIPASAPPQYVVVPDIPAGGPPLVHSEVEEEPQPAEVRENSTENPPSGNNKLKESNESLKPIPVRPIDINPLPPRENRCFEAMSANKCRIIKLVLGLSWAGLCISTIVQLVNSNEEQEKREAMKPFIYYSSSLVGLSLLHMARNRIANCARRVFCP